MKCDKGALTHQLPDARSQMDSTYRRCPNCGQWFVVCSIMGEATYSRHWIWSMTGPDQSMAN